MLKKHVLDVLESFSDEEQTRLKCAITEEAIDRLNKQTNALKIRSDLTLILSMLPNCIAASPHMAMPSGEPISITDAMQQLQADKSRLADIIHGFLAYTTTSLSGFMIPTSDLPCGEAHLKATHTSSPLGCDILSVSDDLYDMGQAINSFRADMERRLKC